MIKINKTLCFVRSLCWRRSTTQLLDFMVVDEKTLVLGSNLEFSIRRWRSSTIAVFWRKEIRFLRQ